MKKAPRLSFRGFLIIIYMAFIWFLSKGHFPTQKLYFPMQKLLKSL